MSETATATHDDHHDGAHPTETQYWIVFVALAVLTAVEVLWYFLPFEGLFEVVPLLIMMVAKFLLVGGAFMHLYFDMKMLNGRLFTWAFAGAIVLAIAVYFIVFATFEFSF